MRSRGRGGLHGENSVTAGGGGCGGLYIGGEGAGWVNNVNMDIFQLLVCCGGASQLAFFSLTRL